MDKLIHGQGYQYAQQDTSKYFNEFMAENAFDLLVIDRIVEFQTLQCFQIADQLLCQLDISACVVADIGCIVNNDEAEYTGNREEPSFMPIAIVRAVTVELCELGKPPQAMH